MASEIKYTKRATETVRDVAGDIVQMLKQAGETVGVAESLTGGGIMAALTSVEGASAVFRGGVVSYATPLKRLLLSVDAELISRHGVIHGDVAEQMATGARIITTFHDTLTTWGISTTGVAGPDPQDGKPVGMVFIGIASVDGSQAWGPFHFPGARDRVREATVMEALARLRETLAARSHQSKVQTKKEVTEES
jgi:nicotinamide-nucleotide amidase